MKSKARLTKVTRAFLYLLLPNISSLASLMQRLQLIKYLWKTTRIQTISGLVNTADLRYSRHRCGKIRSRVSQLGQTYKDHLMFYIECECLRTPVACTVQKLYSQLQWWLRQGSLRAGRCPCRPVLRTLSELPPKEFRSSGGSRFHYKEM